MYKIVFLSLENYLKGKERGKTRRKRPAKNSEAFRKQLGAEADAQRQDLSRSLHLQAAEQKYVLECIGKYADGMHHSRYLL